MGRPTKLTPELQAEICELIRKGNFVETACEAVGVHKGTYYNWRNRGERSAKGVYCDFFNAIKRAEADGEAAHVANIAADNTNTKDWQRSAWWLERRYPQRWGKVDRVDVTSKGEGIQQPKIRLDQLSGDELNILAKIIADRATADTG